MKPVSRIEILDKAVHDLAEGFRFYESRDHGLGHRFLDGLFSDIDSLIVNAGIHPVVFGFHRLLSRRFPFAIYYKVEGNTARVLAVLDCRRDPAWIKKQIR